MTENSANPTNRIQLLTHLRFEYWSVHICLSSLIVISFLSSSSHAAFNEFQVTPHAIPLEEIASGGPQRDDIPALINLRFLPTDQVDFLSPQDRALGSRSQKYQSCRSTRSPLPLPHRLLVCLVRISSRHTGLSIDFKSTTVKAENSHACLLGIMMCWTDNGGVE